MVPGHCTFYPHPKVAFRNKKIIGSIQTKILFLCETALTYVLTHSISRSRNFVAKNWVWFFNKRFRTKMTLIISCLIWPPFLGLTIHSYKDFYLFFDFFVNCGVAGTKSINQLTCISSNNFSNRYTEAYITGIAM